MYTVCIHPPPCLQVIDPPKMGKTGVNIILEQPTVTNKNLLHQPMASNSPEIMGFSDLRIGSRSGGFRGPNRNSLETTIPNLKSVCSNSSPAWRYGNRRSTAEPRPLRTALCARDVRSICGTPALRDLRQTPTMSISHGLAPFQAKQSSESVITASITTRTTLHSP